MDAKSTEQYNENEKVEAYKQNVAEVFPARLLALRKAIGVSQEAFAKKMGVSRGCIAYYESGQRIPDIAFVSAVSAITGCSLDYLFGRSEHMQPDFAPFNRNCSYFDQLTDDMLRNLFALIDNAVFPFFLESRDFVELLGYMEAAAFAKSLHFSAITNELIEYKAAVAFSKIAEKAFDKTYKTSRCGREEHVSKAAQLLESLSEKCLFLADYPEKIKEILAASSDNPQDIIDKISDAYYRPGDKQFAGKYGATSERRPKEDHTEKNDDAKFNAFMMLMLDYPHDNSKDELENIEKHQEGEHK